MLLLQHKECLLHGKAAAVAGEGPVGADDTVTGDDNEKGIGIVGHAHGAVSLRMADGLSDVPVAPRFPIGNLPERRPHLLLKSGALGTAGKVKSLPSALEILIQLPEYCQRQPEGRLPLRPLLRHPKRNRPVFLIGKLHISKRGMVNGCLHGSLPFFHFYIEYHQFFC